MDWDKSTQIKISLPIDLISLVAYPKEGPSKATKNKEK